MPKIQLPMEVEVKCGLCGASHKSKITYSEEVKDNKIILTVHAELSPEYTAHVARVHLDVEGVPQHLEHGNAEPPDGDRGDAGDGDGALGKAIEVTDVPTLLSGRLDARSDRPATSATTDQRSAYDRVHADLTLEDG